MTGHSRNQLPERVRILDRQILSQAWGCLAKYTIDYRRSDGSSQELMREVYDKGDGVALLLYNRDQGTVVLTQQFRFPAFLAGVDADLIEVCAGLLDDRDPETAIRAEAHEETGYEIGPPERLWTAFMSPGAITERLHFFMAPYHAGLRTSQGGGLSSEGEDITVLEMPLATALSMIADGRIVDAKTIMLLHYAALKGLCR